jgi:phosphonate degradation associated HDIG domain protein
VTEPAGLAGPTVDDVVALYERWGSDRYDEQLSQREHALQTAAQAVAANAPEPLIVAALLHDVGHLLQLQAAGRRTGATRDLTHEAVGARYLARLLPPAVTRSIALHVRAKRYLCATDRRYHAQLSDGSQRSLALQGGPLSPDEVAAFEQLPGHADAVRLRIWDDRGKVLGRSVPGLDAYRPLLDRLAGASASVGAEPVAPSAQDGAS